MPFASIGTNKGKCPLIPKKRDKPAKRVASSSRGSSSGGATNIGGSRGGFGVVLGVVLKLVLEVMQAKEVRGSSIRGKGSNTIPFQGLKDEASDEEMAIDEDDQFWEECARKFDHVEEHRA
ncbi:hypothetical protein Tco_0166467 [Tanacetum coccineum]